MDGLDRLYDIKRPGPARRLTAEQLAELKADLIAGPQKQGFESGMWTGKLVVRHVLNKYHRASLTRGSWGGWQTIWKGAPRSSDTGRPCGRCPWCGGT